MSKFRNTLRDQRGQGVVEAVLVIAALFFISSMVSRYFQSEQIVSGIVKGPWNALSGMISYGSWQPPDQAAAVHPISRPSTVDPRNP
jgi:hypothetical protein